MPMLKPTLIVLLLVLLPALAYADLAGTAAVIDGDTIEIGGQRIRLFGIDAPEHDQICQAGGSSWRCGQLAALALQSKIARRPVSCTQKDVDQYARIVAVCAVQGDALNAYMVAEGWALAYRQIATDYVAEENAASTARKGIWRGSFVAPWDWRRGKREAMAGDAQPQPLASGCLIKGNISASGERIYHVPGGALYDQTHINAAQGERWFCTEAEAVAAGWRRSKR